MKKIGLTTIVIALAFLTAGGLAFAQQQQGMGHHGMGMASEGENGGDMSQAQQGSGDWNCPLSGGAMMGQGRMGMMNPQMMGQGGMGMHGGAMMGQGGMGMGMMNRGMGMGGGMGMMCPKMMRGGMMGQGGMGMGMMGRGMGMGGGMGMMCPKMMRGGMMGQGGMGMGMMNRGMGMGGGMGMMCPKMMRGGMMGQGGMGMGMMGRGMGMHRGMMGMGKNCPSMMHGGMMGSFKRRPLTADEAAEQVKVHLNVGKNPNLKMGAVTEEENYFEVEVTTQGGETVHRIQVDKNHGWFRSAYDTPADPDEGQETEHHGTGESTTS